MKNKTIIVSLFGAPGAGKSTLSAYIFAKLKMLGVNCELVTEFAKDKVWEKNNEALSNQIYIFAKQYYRISRCADKVDVIITDSPLFLSPFYNKDPEIDAPLKQLVYTISSRYDKSGAPVNQSIFSDTLVMLSPFVAPTLLFSDNAASSASLIIISFFKFVISLLILSRSN